MPIGFRKELATVRHYQLQLAKERAKLQDEELEISHQLADAVRQLKLNYELTQTNFNRTLAAERQVEAVQAAFEAETVTLDQLLEAQRRRAEAQASFFRTLLDYQRSIIMVHYRKGSLLEYNNVYLTEGPWPAKAKFDAHRLARQRDAAWYINYGFTRPEVLSQGPSIKASTATGFRSDNPDCILATACRPKPPLRRNCQRPRGRSATNARARHRRAHGQRGPSAADARGRIGPAGGATANVSGQRIRLGIAWARGSRQGVERFSFGPADYRGHQCSEPPKVGGRQSARHGR